MKKKNLVIALNSSWNAINFRSGLIKALRKEGWDICVLAPRDEYSSQLEGLGCKYVELKIDAKGKSIFRDIFLILRFYLILRAQRPSALLTYTIKPTIYGSLVARLLGIPVVNNIAGLGAVFVRNNFLTSLVVFLYKISLRKSHQIFFQNSNDYEEFKLRSIISDKNCSVLPGSGVDLNLFNKDSYAEQLRDAHGSNETKEGQFIFLMVARLLWEKGVQEFIDAIRLVRRQNPHVKFQYLGFVDVENDFSVSREDLDSWVEEGLIEFLGSTDDVRPYLFDCDCVVLPSYYREGTPRALIEAAAMSVPIITTDWVGCRDVVDHGVNGYLCRARDARSLSEQMFKMIRLTPEALSVMSQRSREKAEKQFDEKFVINAYVDALKGI